MKYLLLASLLLLGCRKEDDITKKLRPDEIDALRQRAIAKCLKDEEDDINDIIKNVNQDMFKFNREDTWEYKYTKDNSVVEVHKLHVWKYTPTAMYFLLIMEEGGTSTQRYIKITPADNASHFKDLMQKKCAKTFTSSSINSSSVIAKIEDPKVPVDSDNYYINTTTYTYTEQLPAYFGILNKKRIKKTYNKDDDRVNKTENFSWDFTRVGDTDLPGSHTYPGYTNIYYCVPSYTLVSGIPTYPLPNVDNYGLSCFKDPADAPDRDNDGVQDFHPSELVF